MQEIAKTKSGVKGELKGKAHKRQKQVREMEFKMHIAI